MSKLVALIAYMSCRIALAARITLLLDMSCMEVILACGSWKRTWELTMHDEYVPSRVNQSMGRLTGALHNSQSKGMHPACRPEQGSSGGEGTKT